MILLKIMVLAYIQSISFAIVSRARNRDNVKYHVIASLFSNSIWFLTFRELVRSDMDSALFIPYVLGSIAGLVTGAKISMWIEKLIGAKADPILAENKDEKV
jgi:uncharacterized membrane protein YfcA